MQTLKDKKIWITGASSGIGEALSLELARAGAHLVLLSRNLEKLEKVKEACLKHTSFCLVEHLDLSKSEEMSEVVTRIMDRIGGIDILFNNAGQSQRSLAKETPVEIDRKVMEVNFFGVITLTKLVLPYMLQQGSGHIVAISSITGKFGFPWRTAYSAAKHAIQGFFESLRAELKEDNIKVTIVSPGRIKTNISLNAITQDGVSYNKMDSGQAGGMSPRQCAKKIVKAVRNERKEVLVGNRELLMVYIRRFLPGLYHRLVTKINN
ncbi:SDR family oxidoreductase [Thermophagus sp. OGC60D27]|uniref:SDR family oxidoreductase n=1 Tax=Thermophagus sp. OGC60D27 TaxID=3458415 RepID=UPI0040375EF4